MNRILVVIPAFNEDLSIGSVIDGLVDLNFDILVVDDGSTDKTSDVAHSSGATVISHSFNLGVGGALRTGFKFAILNGYDTVIQVDADGQHLPIEIEKLIKTAAETNADMVIGSRFLDSEKDQNFAVSGIRQVGMKFLALIASNAAGAPLTDTTSGFRLIRNPLLKAFSRQFASNYLGDTFEAVVAAGRAGYLVREVPVEMRDRQFGVSSASFLQAAFFFGKAFLVAILRLQPRLPKRT